MRRGQGPEETHVGLRGAGTDSRGAGTGSRGAEVQEELLSDQEPDVQGVRVVGERLSGADAGMDACLSPCLPPFFPPVSLPI